MVATALREVTRSPVHADRATLAATLRRAKRRLGLASAIADIGGVWPLDRVTGARCPPWRRPRWTRPSPTRCAPPRPAGTLRCRRAGACWRECGFTVLGMGKLGARELNYSSDIDLVLIYDPARHPDHADGLGAVFTRVARDVCTLMEARDADGYVFRTDLRLRPDPAPRRPRSACPQPSPTTKAWARTGSGPP